MIYHFVNPGRRRVSYHSAERIILELIVRNDVMFGADDLLELRDFVSEIERRMVKGAEFITRRYVHKIDENEKYWNITRTR